MSMTCADNVLAAMTGLALTRPRPDAPPEVVASWFDAKALLHRTIADQGGADAARARDLALSATQRALALRSAPAPAGAARSRRQMP
ncbi:hypothetical protein BH11ACT6_BH11ACT6_08860 [soil metagenome]